ASCSFKTAMICSSVNLLRFISSDSVDGPDSTQIWRKLRGSDHYGSGDRVSNPPMNGAVAHFLKVPGGREYLGRVPGVATTDLDDARLANLLNWTLYRFDRANVPTDFKPYDAAEIRRLRASPLRVEAARTRAQLVAKMPGGSL
ncbi:MAG: hypothetical protein KBA57_01485, partial [Sphingomonadaceae bacterium]|nr:hypothetical protein [Sphingomonadaceae bacterium]